MLPARTLALIRTWFCLPSLLHRLPRLRLPRLPWGRVLLGLPACALWLGLSACSGTTDDGYDSSCSGSTDDVCVSWSDDPDSLDELIRLIIQLEFSWESSRMMTGGWSPLIRLGVAPRSATLSFTANQPALVQTRFDFSVAPETVAQQLLMKVEDPDGILASTHWSGVWTTSPHVTFTLRTNRPVGMTAHTLRLHLCRDETCTQTYQGSPVTLPITLIVN